MKCLSKTVDKKNVIFQIHRHFVFVCAHALLHNNDNNSLSKTVITARERPSQSLALLAECLVRKGKDAPMKIICYNALKKRQKVLKNRRKKGRKKLSV